MSIQKVLIANRGEIAVRVANSCRLMGIKTVAVYSEADASMPHVEAADEAVLLGPPPVGESYLRAELILEAARKTGADAIHPGYGFLSENADFASKVEAAGLIWIGPPPEAISSMGQKIAARERMMAAKVPVVPGYNASEGQDLASLKKAAEEIGFPVLVKASSGGGGKGMREVFSASEFEEALTLAQREAAQAFGDPTVYLEKLLIQPRHVEIQIFGDQHGNVIHMGERDCSIQRRHQKVVEESPAPGLSESLRKKMGLAAVKAGEAVNYVGAGTVEFMLVKDEKADEGASFYFLEMNTRLQVEHPVTELVTGLDLVALQLEVAMGKSLEDVFGSLPRPDEGGLAPVVPLRGHAMEVRLYAEDPENDFLPSIGTLSRFALPFEPGIRLDTGFTEGAEVSMYYDPMLAKLIAFGPTREHARHRLIDALSRWRIHGVKTNVDFLRAILEHPAFAREEVHTGFIAQEWKDGFQAGKVPLLAWFALALDANLPRLHGRKGGGSLGSSDGGQDPIFPWAEVGQDFGGVK